MVSPRVILDRKVVAEDTRCVILDRKVAKRPLRIGDLGILFDMTKPVKTYFAYIIANYSRTVLYIGVTNDLERRMYEHKNGLFEGFSKKYQLHYLVYFEESPDINATIAREKQLKKWKRAWKNKLIRDFNPKWEDLSADWT